MIKKSVTKNKEEKIKKTIIWSIIGNLVVSLIISLIIKKTFSLPLTLFVIIFVISFLSIYSVVDFLITKNEDRQKYSIKLLFEILTIMILIGQLSVAVNQNSISAQQTNILAKTTSLNQADPDIIVSKESLVIRASTLTHFTKSLEESWAKIFLQVINFGQIDTYGFGCFYSISGEQNDSLRAFLQIKGTPNETSQLGNLRSGELKEVILHIQDKECYQKRGELCQIPELSGNYTITLNCECAGCKDKRYFTKPINFCIYKENITSECLEKGWEDMAYIN